ncbi:MAG: GAF domain-containing protein, partial [Gammaproteobacteria bacterium]
ARRSPLISHAARSPQVKGEDSAVAMDEAVKAQQKALEAFPGHVACSAATRSEVVVPIRAQGQVVAVLDIDSTELNGFSADDVAGLEAVAELVETSRLRGWSLVNCASGSTR